MRHKPPLPLTEPPKRLCVVRLSAIGDCCHLLPVIRTLQAVWPETSITWVMGRTEAALLGDLDGIECITFDKRAGLAAYRALGRALRDRRYDALLLMQVALRAGLLSRLIPADLRLGFDAARSRDIHGLLVNQRIAPNPNAHVMDGFFDFLKALGIHERVLRWDVPLPEAARDRAEGLIPTDQGALVISPCSSQRANNFRNWRQEDYAALARYAHDQYGLRVLVTGGPTEEERRYGEAITRLAGVPVTNLVADTSLKELFAILQRATVVVSPDSGPVHMAVAAGTPVIGLYATSNPNRTGPYLGRQWVVNCYPDALRSALGKTESDVRWGQRVRKPDAMGLIPLSAVTGRLDQLMDTPPALRLRQAES